MDLEEALKQELEILKSQGFNVDACIKAAMKAMYEHGYDKAIDFVACGE